MKNIIIALILATSIPSFASDFSISQMEKPYSGATASVNSAPLAGSKNWPQTLGSTVFTFNGGTVIAGSYPDSIVIYPSQYKLPFLNHFNSDSTTVEIVVRNVGGSVSLYDDDQYVGTLQVGTNTALGYYRWVFSTYKNRRLTAVCSDGAQFVGVNTLPTATVTPAILKNEWLVEVGDSGMGSYGADSSGSGWGVKSAIAMHKKFWGYCMNGTGYLVAGSNISYTDRIPDIINFASTHPNVTVLVGGGGADSASFSVLSAGVKNFISSLQSAGITVKGMLPLDNFSAPMFPNQRAAILDGFQASGISYFDPFVSGLFNAQNAPTLIWTVPPKIYHPNQKGCDAIFAFIAPWLDN